MVWEAVSHRYNVILSLFYLTSSPSSYWTTWSAHAYKQSHLQHSATFVSPKNYCIPLLLHKSSTMQPSPSFFLHPLDAPLCPNTLSNLVPKLLGLNGPRSSMRWTDLLAGGSWGGKREVSWTLFIFFSLQVFYLSWYHYWLNSWPCKLKNKVKWANKPMPDFYQRRNIRVWSELGATCKSCELCPLLGTVQ